MKKKTVLYIFLIVAAIFAILVVTKQLPPAQENESAGTIGKVNKYRKVQMTEKDIILRSEFTKDPNALAESIQGLILFNVFAKDYAVQLKKWSNDLEKADPSLTSLTPLKDYYTFLNKNVPSVENIIEILTEYYTGDTTEMSLDVEKKLSDFYVFASQLFAKDSVINQIIPELEKKISKKLVLNDERDEEIKKLKEVHDQMLLKTLQIAVLAGNKKSVDNALKGTLYNSSNLQGSWLESKTHLQNATLGTFIKNNLGPLLFSQVSLNPMLFSQDNLGIFAQEKLGPAMAQEKLGPACAAAVNFGNAVLKNTPSLGPIYFFSRTELQNSIKSSLGTSLNSKLEAASLMNMNKLGSF